MLSAQGLVDINIWRISDAHYPATPSSPSLGRYKVATLPKGMARGAIAISRQKTSRVYYLRHLTGVQNWISALIPYLHTSHTEHAVNLYMNPTVVSEYIAKECSAGRLLGPVPAPSPTNQPLWSYSKKNPNRESGAWFWTYPTRKVAASIWHWPRPLLTHLCLRWHRSSHDPVLR